MVLNPTGWKDPHRMEIKSCSQTGFVVLWQKVKKWSEEIIALHSDQAYFILVLYEDIRQYGPDKAPEKHGHF